MKTNFAKGLEISGIEVYPRHFTASFEDTIDAILKKALPRDLISQGSSHQAVIRLKLNWIIGVRMMLFFHAQKLTA